MKYYYYEITNLANNKKYCGITRDPNTRKNRHFRELEKDCHHSIRLQNAFNKYGKNNFVFEVVDSLETESSLEAFQKEKELIAKNNSYENGYNMTPGGEINITPEMLEKMRLSHEKLVPNVYQIDKKTLQVIKIFPSLRAIQKELGLSHSNVSKVCNRQDISAGGYYWCYEQDWSDTWIPPINQKYKPIAIVDDNNEIIRVFESCADAGRKLNLHRENIRDAILRGGKCGKRKFIFITREQYEQYACRD